LTQKSTGQLSGPLHGGLQSLSLLQDFRAQRPSPPQVSPESQVPFKHDGTQLLLLVHEHGSKSQI
jgi:hypothetical protein